MKSYAQSMYRRLTDTEWSSIIADVRRFSLLHEWPDTPLSAGGRTNRTFAGDFMTARVTTLRSAPNKTDVCPWPYTSCQLTPELLHKNQLYHRGEILGTGGSKSGQDSAKWGTGGAVVLS